MKLFFRNPIFVFILITYLKIVLLFLLGFRNIEEPKAMFGIELSSKEIRNSSFDNRMSDSKRISLSMQIIIEFFDGF